MEVRRFEGVLNEDSERGAVDEGGAEIWGKALGRGGGSGAGQTFP